MTIHKSTHATASLASLLKLLMLVFVGLAAMPSAQAEVIHNDGLNQEQTGSTAIGGEYQRDIIFGANTRITDVVIQLSETQASSTGTRSTMSLSIGSETFQLVNSDVETGRLHFSGDAEFSGGSIVSFNLTCLCFFGQIYLSETSNYSWTSTAGFWVPLDSNAYPRIEILENERPVLTAVPNQQSIENHNYDVPLTANDPEGRDLTWSESGLPRGLSINSSTGRITGAPSVVGNFNVAVTVTDDAGGSDTANFTWAVSANNAPEIASIDDQNARERDQADLQLSAIDADGDALVWSVAGLPPGLTFNRSTRDITGTMMTPGSYNVEVQVSDNFGGVSTRRFAWEVAANNAPVLSTIDNQSSRTHVPFELSAAATDADGDGLTYEASGLPIGVSFNTANGMISGTPGVSGEFTVTISVRDVFGASASTSFVWQLAANHAPVISPLADVEGRVGEALIVNVSASDEDGDAVNYRETGLPSGFTINPDTGSILGTPSATGVFSVTILARDEFGDSDRENFAIRITDNNQPVITPVNNQSSQVNEELSFSLGATDSDGDTVTWAASGLPTGLMINENTGIIDGIPSVIGGYHVTVSANDGHDGIGTLSFGWHITEPPAAEAPAAEAPAAEAPAEEAPAQQEPAQQAPAEEAPAQQAPAQQEPAAEAPAQQAPAEEAPAQQEPAEEAPAQQEPAEEAPAQQAPAQQQPANSQQSSPENSQQSSPENSQQSGQESGQQSSPENSADNAQDAGEAANDEQAEAASESEAANGQQAEVASEGEAANDEQAEVASEGEAANDEQAEAASEGEAANDEQAEGDQSAEGDSPQATESDSPQATESDSPQATESDSDSAQPTESEELVEMQAEPTHAEPQPTHHISYVELEDVSVMNALETSRQSLLPVLNPVMHNSFSRLSELVGQSTETFSNRSSLNLKLAFADTVLQQISNIGTIRALGDLLDDEVDSWLPDGWAVWSRGEVFIGKLKAAETGENIDIDGNHFAFGADKRVTDRLTVGGFFQAGSSQATASSDSETEAETLSFYGSYILSENQYLQAAFGISDLNLSMQRDAFGDVYDGQRDGATSHLLINAAQRVQIDEVDLVVSVELGHRRTTLDEYTEGFGVDSYHYNRQSLRDDHIGFAVRVDEHMDTDYGLLSVTGELGYRADLSRDSEASLYKLADTTTIYTHHVDRSDKAQSSSHARLALGAGLVRDNGWVYKANTNWRDYKTGYIAGVNLSAAYRF